MPSSCVALPCVRGISCKVGLLLFCHFLATNWTASEMILPPFLERRFGEGVPIYTIQSINLFGCLFLPPVVGVLTSAREDFSVILPGNASGCSVLQVAMHVISSWSHTCNVAIVRPLDHGRVAHICGNLSVTSRHLHLAGVPDSGRSLVEPKAIILDCLPCSNWFRRAVLRRVKCKECCK